MHCYEKQIVLFFLSVPFVRELHAECESVNASLRLHTLVGHFITILCHQMSSYSIDL